MLAFCADIEPQIFAQPQNTSLINGMLGRGTERRVSKITLLPTKMTAQRRLSYNKDKHGLQGLSFAPCSTSFRDMWQSGHVGVARPSLKLSRLHLILTLGFSKWRS